MFVRKYCNGKQIKTQKMCQHVAHLRPIKEAFPFPAATQWEQTLISHLWFRASSIYYINKPTWCNFMQSHLFFIAIHSTCFGRLLQPSSGAQLNCSYSHRYISSVCVVWLKSVERCPRSGVYCTMPWHEKWFILLLLLLLLSSPSSL
jgi:hypothetical protein